MSKASVLFCLIILVFAVSANCSKTELGIYEIKKGDFSVKVTNYGARIISVLLPDKNGHFFYHWSIFWNYLHFLLRVFRNCLFFPGKIGDVVLGYDTIKEYEVCFTLFCFIVQILFECLRSGLISLNLDCLIWKDNEQFDVIHILYYMLF